MNTLDNTILYITVITAIHYENTIYNALENRGVKSPFKGVKLPFMLPDEGQK